MLELYIHSREEWDFCKRSWEKEKDPILKAAMWYYVQVYSFNGYGASFGRGTRTTAALLSKRLPMALPGFTDIHRRFKNVQVEQLHWRQMLDDYDHPKMVFYLDPPYLSTHGNYSGGQKDKYTFSESDHIDLLERIFRLEGHVVISGYDSELYNMFPWEYKHTWTVATSANMKDQGQGTAQECLWVKPSIAK
jgi:DNA adenine methylase